jgi:Uma2 family endonuclease
VIQENYMSVQPRPYLTAFEYLALERGSTIRHEYFDGERFAMTGGSLRHNQIVVNLSRELSLKLKSRPCGVYANDLRVRITESGLYTYPDVVVVCGEPQLEDAHLDTLLNPTLIVEVLSPSTEAYDRGKKFEHYRTLESLEEYLLVAQNEPRVEQYLRQPDDRWLLAAFSGRSAALPLPSIGCELRLAEVYEKVGLD